MRQMLKKTKPNVCWKPNTAQHLGNTIPVQVGGSIVR